MMQSRDPCIHRRPDGEVRGGFTVNAVGQHGNGINKKINRGRDGGWRKAWLQLSRSSNLRGDESSGGRDLAFLLKGRGKTRKRAKREKREGREEIVRHLKAGVWAAKKLEAPRSHLDRAGRQESVGNNRGGRAVGWVKSDEPVAKNRKKIYLCGNQAGSNDV